MKKNLVKQIILGAMALSIVAGGGSLLMNQSDALAVGASTPAASSAAPAGNLAKPPLGHLFKEVRADLLVFLKLDQTTFETKLKSGKTLAQIAADQGITRTALKAELTKEANAAIDREKTDFAADLDHLIDLANLGKLDAHTGVRGGKGHNRFNIDLTDTAQLLGLTKAELENAIVPGKSIADIAVDKGVAVQSLINLQVKQIIAKLTADLAAGKITQAQHDTMKANSLTFATAIVNDKHDGTGRFGGIKGPRGRHHGNDFDHRTDPGTTTSPTASPSA